LFTSAKGFHPEGGIGVRGESSLAEVPGVKAFVSPLKGYREVYKGELRF
jgi:hypothetical protein